MCFLGFEHSEIRSVCAGAKCITFYFLKRKPPKKKKKRGKNFFLLFFFFLFFFPHLISSKILLCFVKKKKIDIKGREKKAIRFELVLFPDSCHFFNLERSRNNTPYRLYRNVHIMVIFLFQYRIDIDSWMVAGCIMA